MEKMDWTQWLVPRTVANENWAGQVDARLTTTDYVTIPTVSEWQDPNHVSRVKPNTDFARQYFFTKRTVDRVYHNTYEGVYRLRTPEQVTDGTTVMSKNVRNTEIGLAPCFSLKLPTGYTMTQLTKQFGLTKQTNAQGETFYQVSLGEYPRGAATGLQRIALNREYVNRVESDDFYCTGRLFTAIRPDWSDSDNPTQIVHLQYPEYSYQGQKYVRVGESFGAAWYLVEPMQFVVKNYAEIASGQARQMDLECAEVILAGMPYHVHDMDFKAAFWQNSLPRAFLNGKAARELDGYHAYRTEEQWDYAQGGFLQEALNMTREPTRVYTIPAGEMKIADRAFEGCRGLEKVIIPSRVQSIGLHAFESCRQAQLWFERSNREFIFSQVMFSGINPEYIYVPKTTDGQWLVLAPQLDHNLDKDYHCLTAGTSYTEFFDANYCTNFIQLNQWKAEQKIKFIPPEYVMKVFPASEMANFFVNNNHKRWKELIQALNFNLLEPDKKENALPDLMKIYYALGGFATEQSARDKAFNYVTQHVAKLEIEVKQTPEMVKMVNMMTELPARLAEMAFSEGLTTNLYQDEFTPAKTRALWVGNEIHSRFSRLTLKGPYNPTFAQFFMKYYHENHDFMKFDLGQDEQDYLCLAHNHFDKILENYPNRVVNGNTERDLLTPEFVAEHSTEASYENVDAENQGLAELVGKYGYDQEEFGHIQQIFNTAKTVKSRAVIRADQTTAVNGISFRVLAKDDPLGFVIGDITNCCQHIGGAGSDCVSDGYINPHAGFLVFETDEKRILGQAYVWYDPVTYTVCYDNIEIPDKVLTELKHGEKHHANLSMSNLMQAVINSADAIMTTMNQNGTKVERVTVGKGYNDLATVLQTHYPIITARFAYHRDYYGYTDAASQYLIRTYDQVKTKLTTMTANTSADLLKAAANLSKGATKQDDDNTLVL